MTDKFNQDGSINENWLAEEITQRQKLLDNPSLAANPQQVEDVLKITLDILVELIIEGEENKIYFFNYNAGRMRVDQLLGKHKEF